MARAAAVSGQILNAAELAGLLGVSRMTITAYIDAGCPMVEKGAGRHGYKFNSSDVLAWRDRRAAEARVAAGGELSSDQVRRRYTLATAELKELQLAEKRGSLVPIEAVTATLADELTAVRGRLLAMPGRLGMSLVGKTDPAEVEAAIAEEVRGALSELTAG
jgi:phage terminase Nu1 subunit (DNA packaging protein)